MAVTIPRPRGGSGSLAHLLVTGGAGYIGSHALRALRARGPLGGRGRRPARGPRRASSRDVPLWRHDVGDRERAARALRRATAPSTACSISPPRSRSRSRCASPLDVLAQQRAGLAPADRGGARRTACAPSCSPRPRRLRAPRVPADPGGEPARAHQPVRRVEGRRSSSMLADVERAHGLRWAALRYFNACGRRPRRRARRVPRARDPPDPVALEAAAGLRPELVALRHRLPDARRHLHPRLRARHRTSPTRTSARSRRCSRAAPAARTTSAPAAGAATARCSTRSRDVVGRPVPWREGARRDGRPRRARRRRLALPPRLRLGARRSDLDTIVGTAWAGSGTRRGSKLPAGRPSDVARPAEVSRGPRRGVPPGCRGATRCRRRRGPAASSSSAATGAGCRAARPRASCCRSRAIASRIMRRLSASTARFRSRARARQRRRARGSASSAAPRMCSESISTRDHRRRRPRAPPCARSRSRARARCRASAWATSRSIAAFVKPLERAGPSCWLARSRKWCASAGMSSRRSRSGGQLDLDHAQPVVEVLAEAARRRRALRRSRFVAAMMRTSTLRVSEEPSGRISPSCSTRSSRTCMPGSRLADLVEEDRAAVRRPRTGPSCRRARR